MEGEVNKHTPIPWNIDYNGPARIAIVGPEGECVAVTMMGTEDGDLDEGNAELIVTTVNNHEALATCLIDLLEWASMMGGFESDVWRRAEELRERLKGGSE